MRASALSDDRVIAAVNRHFVAVTVNVTTMGFPVHDIPALKYAYGVFQTNRRFEFGFASCIAVGGGMIRIDADERSILTKAY